MPKLTDAQLAVLSKAYQREDGAAIVPHRIAKTAALKLAASLVGLKLMREIRAKPEMPVWRVDEEGRSYSLVILKGGREALGIEEARNHGAQNDLSLVDAAEKHSGANACKMSPAVASSTTEARPAGCRAGSKQALVISLLERANGATIDELMATTHWLPHTVRAALTVLRKRGYEVVRQRSDGVTRYRVKGSSGVRKAA